jgi:hypothetical protein
MLLARAFGITFSVTIPLIFASFASDLARFDAIIHRLLHLPCWIWPSPVCCHKTYTDSTSYSTMGGYTRVTCQVWMHMETALPTSSPQLRCHLTGSTYLAWSALHVFLVLWNLGQLTEGIDNWVVVGILVIKISRIAISSRVTSFCQCNGASHVTTSRLTALLLSLWFRVFCAMLNSGSCMAMLLLV